MSIKCWVDFFVVAVVSVVRGGVWVLGIECKPIVGGRSNRKLAKLIWMLLVWLFAQIALGICADWSERKGFEFGELD